MARHAASILPSSAASRSGDSAVSQVFAASCAATTLEETNGVALFGDVATEQLPGLDVDGVVAEEAVEDVGGVRSGCVLQHTEQLRLLEVGAVGTGDLHALGELGIVRGLQFETKLVDPLRERHAVFAFTSGDGVEHRAHVRVSRDLGPRRQVLECARLRDEMPLSNLR